MATTQITPNISTLDIHSNRAGINRQLISRWCEMIIHKFDAQKGFVHASESFQQTVFHVKQLKKSDDDTYTVSFFSKTSSAQTREVIDHMGVDPIVGTGSIVHDLKNNHVVIEFSIVALRKSYEGR